MVRFLLFGWQVRINAFIDRLEYHCGYGPEDLRGNAATAQPKDPKQRVKRKDLDQSCKRGCKAHFALRRQPRTEDITEVLYYNKEHLNHGQAAAVSTLSQFSFAFNFAERA